MSNNFYYSEDKRKIKEVTALMEIAELGSQFYQSEAVTRSLIKIGEHLDKASEESKKMQKFSHKNW